MTNQLPPPGAMFLDHVAHFVPEMDAAAAALERCGSRLTHYGVAAEEPAAPAARFGRSAGRPAPHAGEVTTIALERGAIHIAQPRYLRDPFGITPAGTLPCFVATQIAVADLARVDHSVQ